MLSGCATTAVHDPDIAWRNTALKMSYCIKSSSEINSITKSLSEKGNKKDFEKHVQLAIADIHDYVKNNIARDPEINIQYHPTCSDDHDHSNQATDFVLTIDLSGYGSIKKEWKKVLIGTGIAEGIFQGLVVYAATQNPWLSAAVGGEEITSEYLTWNGVDWILGDAYAPVTLEGSLSYSNDKKILWQDSAFVTENDKVLSKQDKKNKSKQLAASLHKAESELLTSLNKYIKTELVKHPASADTIPEPADW
jgi:hypothetical protein